MREKEKEREGGASKGWVGEGKKGIEEELGRRREREGGVSKGWMKEREE